MGPEDLDILATTQVQFMKIETTSFAYKTVLTLSTIVNQVLVTVTLDNLRSIGFHQMPVLMRLFLCGNES